MAINIANFSDQQILARTAYGENRGGGRIGMQSVLNCIMNRANLGGWWGNTPRTVCLKSNQFDCWIPGNADYEATVNATDDDPSLSQALSMATAALAGTLTDITEGSTYYFAKSMNPWPHWATGHFPAVAIDGQLFFNDIQE